MEYVYAIGAVYLALFLAKIPFVLVAAYEDTVYSFRRGYVRKQSWQSYLILMAIISVSMSFVMLIPMLVMERSRFLSFYDKDTIHKAADRMAEKYDF